MELNLEKTNHPALILECTPDGIRFSSGVFSQPLIIHYRCTEIGAEPTLPKHPRALRLEDFDFLGDHPFEILVVGTGATSLWLPAEVSAAIQARKIGVEVAPTRSASYIFNVLLSEDRSVVALMYPPEAAPADE